MIPHDPETGEILTNPKGKPLDERGRELLDPTPVAPPVGYQRQPSLAEQIRAMVRSEKLRAEAEAAGAETFEEADDFDVGDDFDPSSPYEANFDPIPDNQLAALRSHGRDVDGILGPLAAPERESASGGEPDAPVSGSDSDRSGPSETATPKGGKAAPK